METKRNYETAVEVLGTEDGDSISNYGAYSTVDAGAGNDTITNDRDYMIGLRNDNGLIRYESFEVKGVYSSLVGGAGNDRLVDKVGYSVLNGGAGSDQITLGAFSTLEYGAGDGNDTVVGYNGRNAIHITAGTYATAKSGNDLIVKVGKETLTLKQAAGVNLNIAVGDETLRPTYEDNYNPLIFGTAFDDTIYAPRADMTVEAYEGDDLIVNNSNVGLRAVLNGGLGNDSIVSNSPDITVEGGKGDDVIELSGVNQTVRYHTGEGNDTVLGYQSTDIIHLIDGAEYETVESGFDVVVSVGSGSLTLIDALDKELNIDTTKDDDDYVEEFEWEVGTPEHEKITYNAKKGIVTVADGFNGELDAENFSNGFSQVNASTVSGSVAIKGGTKAVTMYASKGGSTLEGSTANDKIYCGEGEDFYVYTVGEGQDAIGNPKDARTLYQEQDGIVIVSDEHYDLDDVSIKDNKSAVVITFNGDKKSKLTINKADVNTPLKLYFGASADVAFASGYVTYGELPEGVNYALNNKGALDYSRLTVDTTVEGGLVSAAAIHSQIATIDGSNAEGWLELYGNDKNNVLKASKLGSWLDGGTGNDQLYGSTGADAYDTFVFKMQPKGKKDVIYNYDAVDAIMIDTEALDGADLPEFDAELGVITYDGAKSNFNGFNDSKDDVVVTLNKKNSITIKNAAGKAINFIDESGNLLGTFGHLLPTGLKYDKKRTGIEVEDAEIVGTEEDIDIDLSNDYENLYYSSVINIDMTGLNANAMLTGNAKNNILKAGNFYTQIFGGAGNDQIYSSTAEDAATDIYYNSGKDIIYNYNSDVDYVYIEGETPLDYDVLATVTSKNFVEKGNDVILNLDRNNSITFKDGVNRVIEIYDATGALDDSTGYIRYDFSLPEGLKYNSAKRTEITVEDSDTTLEQQDYLNIDLSNETNEEAFEFASTVKKVDLRDITYEDFRAIITGNSLANEMYGANAGYNELYGGHQEFDDPKKARPSSDKLYGGEGEDVFIYGVGDGKDVVMNYGENDVIRLDDTWGEIESVVFTDKKNVVTIEINGDKNNVLTVNKDDATRAIEFEVNAGLINGLEDWYNAGDFSLKYGVDADNMTLSADGSTLSVSGEYSSYVYADAREINTQIKVLDARNAEPDVFVELTGNRNNNALYAGVGGSILDGGRDSAKKKATNDNLYGGESNDVFVYRFEDGLGGKDSVIGFDATSDALEFDMEPTKVTANGTNLLFTFEENIEGKKYGGTLTVNGTSKITSETGVVINIAGVEAVYNFGSKLKNAAWDSDGITVTGAEVYPVMEIVDSLPTVGNTAAQWTMLDENSYAYDYAGVQFTVSGSAVRDWAPDNNFSRGLVIDVIESDGIPDGIMVDAENKAIVLSDRFNASDAKFEFGNDESATDYRWQRYFTFEVWLDYELYEQPTEDYWFDQTLEESPLSEIVSTETAVDLSKEILSPVANSQQLNILTGSARNHLRK